MCPPSDDPRQLPLPETEGADAPAEREGWVRVMDGKELAEGGVRGVKVGDRELCVVRHEGRCAVVDDFCPHQGAPLSTGWIYEGQLVCAWHGWAFDVRSGKMGHGAGPAVRVHETEEREDGIYVKLRTLPRPL